MAKSSIVSTMPDGSINLLDKSAVLAALGLGQKKTEKRTLDLAHLARAKWLSIAKSALHRSLRDYQNGIQVVKQDDNGGAATIDLYGKFPNLIENGIDHPLDMRDWLLHYVREGGEIKMGKHGRYRVIPMRRSFGGTGMSIPLAGGAYDKKLGEDASQALRQAMYKEIKQGKSGLQVIIAGGKMKTVRRGDEISAMDGGPLLKPHHKRGLYAGMTHFTGKDGKDGQYKMFRTISEGVGQGESWMYPAGPGRHFLDQVQEYVAAEAMKMFANED